MAASLLQAIHERWDDDSGLTGAGLRLVDDNPESGADLNGYVVVDGVDGPERPDDFEGGRQVDARWTFRAWGTGNSQAASRARAEATAALIRTAFDRQPLDVDGHSCPKVRVSDTRTRLDQSRSTPARLVHEAEIVFLALLHRRPV